MNFLSLVTIAEALCGPGALDAALAAGGRLRAGDRPDAVAVHSMLAPRAAFCMRRACRRVP